MRLDRAQLAALPSGTQLLVCWPGDAHPRALTLVHLGPAGHPTLVTDTELRHGLPSTAQPLADTVTVRAAEGPAINCPHVYRMWRSRTARRFP